MKGKKLTPLMWCHLFLMILLAAASIVSIFLMMFSERSDSFQEYFSILKVGTYLFALLNAAAMICGILYLTSGYSKRAAGYYKAFIVLAAAFNAVTVYTTIYSQGFGVGAVMMIVKVLLLLALAFWPNLGKRNTWILFGIMLAIDLLFGVLFGSDSSVAVYRLILVLSKLVMDGTIGLAIRGKYQDKDARGTT